MTNYIYNLSTYIVVQNLIEHLFGTRKYFYRSRKTDQLFVPLISQPLSYHVCFFLFHPLEMNHQIGGLWQEASCIYFFMRPLFASLFSPFMGSVFLTWADSVLQNCSNNVWHENYILHLYSGQCIVSHYSIFQVNISVN